MQVHQERESVCLVSYRYHRDVLTVALNNIVLLNRSVFFESVLNILNLFSNLNELIE